MEISESFEASAAVREDSILSQIKRRGDTIVFAGDYIWMAMFSQYFDRAYPQPSFNVNDLDTLDIEASGDIIREIELGNFTLLLGHVIGVDHAGHTFSASHSEIERKLNDTEEIIKEIISRMSEDTTLLVFGDHGMTDDGNHGGASQNELRSVLFAYSKRGFPMRADAMYERMPVKQLDLASIVSHILALPLPFSNLGVIHPLFARSSQSLKDAQGEAVQ